jgi:hypothetical protein
LTVPINIGKKIDVVFILLRRKRVAISVVLVVEAVVGEEDVVDAEVVEEMGENMAAIVILLGSEQAE